MERRMKRDQKRNAWLMRSIANDILNDLVMEVQGKAVAGTILDEIQKIVG